MADRRPRRAGLVAVAAVLLLLAGCGDDGGDDVDTGDGTSATTTTTEATNDTEPAQEAVSVAGAVALDEGTSVTVRGYVFEPDEGATTMCDTLGESFPPTCVGPTLTTDGLDVDSLPGIETTAPGDLVAPATWTSEPVEVSGVLEAGRLVVG